MTLPAPDETAKAIGAAIKRARVAAGMQQKDLAKAADYDAVSLSRAESGLSIPRFDTVIRIAAALNIGVDQLTPPDSNLVFSPLQTRASESGNPWPNGLGTHIAVTPPAIAAAEKGSRSRDAALATATNLMNDRTTALEGALARVESRLDALEGKRRNPEAPHRKAVG